MTVIIPIRKGQKFGQLTATGQFRRTEYGHIHAEVVCSHGVKHFKQLYQLKFGRSQSCSHWSECSTPKKGTKFGKLTATGRFQRVEYGTQGQKRTEVEVICRHGARKFISLGNLKCFHIQSCSHWPECSIPKEGTRFGSFTTTGRVRRAAFGTQGRERTEIEIICPHKEKNWAALGNLKSGEARSCRNWFSCALDAHQLKHHEFLRHHVPRIKIKELAKLQFGLCLLCDRPLGGKITREHLIPMIRAVRWKMSLRRKHEIANGRFNIFAAHHRCNVSRGSLSLKEHWNRNPKTQAQGRQAFANLMAHHRPMGNKDMKFIKRILREAGMYLTDDSRKIAATAHLNAQKEAR
jgi:hypothetical protein